jgi:hypothetical protein
MTLIKINDNHYIVVDDSEIEEGDWYLTFLNRKVIGEPRKCEDDSYSFDNCKRIIYSTDINNNEIWYVPLSEVKELVGEVDMDLLSCYFLLDGQKIYTAFLSDHNSQTALGGFLRGTIHGYNRCLEDNKDKKYTLNDIALAFRAGIEHGIHPDKPNTTEYIKSLKPKTQWQVKFDESGKLKLVN